MKILQINIFGNLSTGKIITDIARTLHENQHDCVIAYARNSIPPYMNEIKIGNKFDVYVHGVMTRITDKAGFYSTSATKKLIKNIEAYKPDIIHLHNLHGYYINIEILFCYLKKSKIPVVWTLHDCWCFTGHCANFEAIGCNKWKYGCEKCPQKKSYPASYFLDYSKQNFKRKQELFTNIENMTLVVPSEWLRILLSQSYMKNYPIVTIRNGIDLNTFKPTFGEWIKLYNLENKKIVLGVAGTWTPTKGLADIIKLAPKLDTSYQIVIVGVSKKDKKKLPQNIIGIERTYDSNELAQIYTAAHCLINPTYDDNFPTVNLESLACGTPVIMYKTGGGPEVITDTCGKVIERGDIKALQKEIESLNVKSEDCLSVAQLFNRKKIFGNYVKLYSNIINRNIIQKEKDE